MIKQPLLLVKQIQEKVGFISYILQTLSIYIPFLEVGTPCDIEML